MFLEDPSRTHVHSAASVAELFESTNQPLVQPAGRAAQPAQAAVLAVDEGGALRVLVVLTLIESQDNVIYASADRVSDAELSNALEEAMLFAESMGFILDGTGWAQMDVGAREQLAGRLSAFRPPSGREKPKILETKVSADPLAQVARLFAAFALGALAISLGACSGPSTEQRLKSAEIHYDLGTNLMNGGDAQAALGEYLQAEKDNPEMAEIHNALGLLYGFSLGRPAEADVEFKQAIALRDDFSEADNNYGAFLLSRERFAEAIPHFERAIGNALYGQRAVAQCNLAWALYKTGLPDRAIAQLRTALSIAPKYCKGWREMGTIFFEKNQLDDSFDAFTRYGEACPEVADAPLQLSIVLARQGKNPQAKAALDHCVELSRVKDPATASECRKHLRDLGAP